MISSFRRSLLDNTQCHNTQISLHSWWDSNTRFQKANVRRLTPLIAKPQGSLFRPQTETYILPQFSFQILKVFLKLHEFSVSGMTLGRTICTRYLCFTLPCFSDPCQYTAIRNLRPVIFGLTTFCCHLSTTLTPAATYFIISCGSVIFYLLLFI